MYIDYEKRSSVVVIRPFSSLFHCHTLILVLCSLMRMKVFFQAVMFCLVYLLSSVSFFFFDLCDLKPALDEGGSSVRKRKK